MSISRQAAIGCLLLFAVTAMGSMGEVSLRSLAHDADLIVLGLVENQVIDEVPDQPETSDEMQGRKVYEVRARVRIADEIKGSAPSPTIDVIAVFGDEDSPVFRVGERAFFFLKLGDGDATYETVARSQGVFAVSDGVVHRLGLTVDRFRSELRGHLD